MSWLHLLEILSQLVHVNPVGIVIHVGDLSVNLEQTNKRPLVSLRKQHSCSFHYPKGTLATPEKNISLCHSHQSDEMASGFG